MSVASRDLKVREGTRELLSCPQVRTEARDEAEDECGVLGDEAGAQQGPRPRGDAHFEAVRLARGAGVGMRPLPPPLHRHSPPHRAGGGTFSNRR